MKTKLLLYYLICFLIVSPLLTTGQNIFLTQQVYAEISQIKIISQQAYIFSEASKDSEIILTAKKGQVFTLLETTEDYYKIQVTDETSGFVLKAFSLDSKIKPIPLNLDTNAKTIKKSFAYVANNNNFNKTNIELDSETKIKILDGYDEKKQFTQISFLHNDEVLTYYILTTDILPDKMNNRIIIALTLIVTCSFLFLILYSFFKGKVTKI